MDGRFGEQYRARQPQPTPPDSAAAASCRACGIRWSRWSRRITSDTRTTTGPTSLARGSARRARGLFVCLCVCLFIFVCVFVCVLHTRHLLGSTHTNTHKHKQTHNVPPPSSSEESASPPAPPASCISVAISRAEAMCTATDRRCVKRCACSASHVDVDQLTSFSYCRFVSLFRSLSCIRRKSRTTGSLQPP